MSQDRTSINHTVTQTNTFPFPYQFASTCIREQKDSRNNRIYNTSYKYRTDQNDQNELQKSSQAPHPLHWYRRKKLAQRDRSKETKRTRPLRTQRPRREKKETEKNYTKHTPRATQLPSVIEREGISKRIKKEKSTKKTQETIS